MIDICLATYNGAKYLDVQIASIVTQTYKDWNLYIHDDGSTDNTIEIVKKWEKLDSRIQFIDDEVKHLGPGNNFFHLLQFCESEYICFCDQDDFWFENKLSEYIHFISQINYTKTTIARKIASIRTFYKFLLRYLRDHDLNESPCPENSLYILSYT